MRNLILAIWEQGPPRRAWKNFVITRNAWGMFHRNSHFRQDTGEPKIMYNRKKSAVKAAESMTNKYGDKHFKVYKCVFCNGYHVGKNNYKRQKMV
jgi:hypothetical protein